MRKVAALAVVLLGTSSAFAGVATFNSGSEVVIDLGIGPGATASVSVTPQAAATFDSVDLIIGSNSGLNVTAFAYSQAFLDASLFEGPPNFAFGVPVYGLNHSVFVGGLQSPPVSSIVVGNVTFNAEGLAPGIYELGVSSTKDLGLSSMGLFGELESVEGSLRVVVVPEPATLSLLGLGLVGLIRRRFAA